MKIKRILSSAKGRVIVPAFAVLIAAGAVIAGLVGMGANSAVAENGEGLIISEGGSVTVTGGAEELTNQGDVQLTKTVKDLGEGKYEVTFGVKGKDYTQTTETPVPIYAVVVFDRSGSMLCSEGTKTSGSGSSVVINGTRLRCNSGSNGINIDKWNGAVNGAKSFASQITTLPAGYVNLVTFASSASNPTGWISSGTWTDSQFGYPYGGTALAAGINRAKTALDNITVEGAQKYIVVIGDGEQSDGDASAAALTARNAGIEVFAIGYDVNGTTRSFLQGLVSSPSHYVDANPDAITGAFTGIAEEITRNFAGSGAVITDTLGKGFVFESTNDTAVTNNGGDTVECEIGDITESGKTCSFVIRFTGTDSDEPLPTGIYPTNEVSNGGVKIEYSNGGTTSITVDTSAEISHVSTRPSDDEILYDTTYINAPAELGLSDLVGQAAFGDAPALEGYKVTVVDTDGSIDWDTGTSAYVITNHLREVTYDTVTKPPVTDLPYDTFYTGIPDTNQNKPADLIGQDKYGDPVSVSGYKANTPVDAPGTWTWDAQKEDWVVGTHNTRTINYDEDRTQTKTISYSVEYYRNGTKIDRDTDVVTNSIWVNSGTTTLTVNAGAINMYDKYAGMVFSHSEPETIPSVISDGGVIRIYYVNAPVEEEEPVTRRTTPITRVYDTIAGEEVIDEEDDGDTLGSSTIVADKQDKGEVLAAETEEDNGAAWALLNLILTIGTVLASLVLLVLYFGKKREDEDEEKEEDGIVIKKHGVVRVLSLVPAVGAVVAFILTEDMRNPMEFVDKWTILMLLIAVVQIVIIFFARKTKKVDEDEEKRKSRR